jgi:photosystem II stability/assembly factor-like uncharacterized protein
MRGMRQHADMRFPIRSMVLIVLATTSLFAQTSGTWQLQSPLPTGQVLHGVDLVSPSEAWAVGEAGVILHTTDGGVTWATQNSGTNQQLNAVRFLDPQHGWAVGGVLLYTTDGGRTWVAGTRTGNMGTLYSVDFVDTSNGWAVGVQGGVLRTTDGGHTWLTGTTPSGQNLIGVDFVDVNTGWAVGGNGTILHTANGGAAWSRQTSNSTAFLQSVSFVNGSEGWVVASAYPVAEILHTTDGGSTWASQSVPNFGLNSVFFFDSLHGWAAGAEGILLNTVDGGQTWVNQLPGPSVPAGLDPVLTLNSVRFTDALNGASVGDGGYILTTTNGGQDWVPQEHGFAGNGLAVTGTDANNAKALLDDSVLLSTSDGGQHWSPTALPIPFTNMYFLDAMHGWAVQEFLPSVYSTTDGGATWQLHNTPSALPLLAVQAIDANTIVAVGGDDRNLVAGDVIVRSTDGGNTWTLLTRPGKAQYFTAVDFVNATTGWVAGSFPPDILMTTDGGMSWAEQSISVPSSDYTLLGLSFADTQNGWSVGALGTVIHTSNGGQIWTIQDPGAPLDPGGVPAGVYAVQAISPSIAWIGGTGGFVSRTTDGGNTWTAEQTPSGTTPQLKGLHFADADNGWLAGTDITNSLGNVWRRTAGAPNLSSFVLSPVSVASGLTATGTLQLSSAAPAGGVNIALGSSRPSVVAVPPSVAIPAGVSSATFTAKTFQVTANTTATVSATLSGGSGATLTAQLTVVPATLVQLTINPSTIDSGRKATATVFLDGLAPAGGAVVTLTSSNTGVASVPPSVTIAQGAGSVRFAVTGEQVQSVVSAVITASWKGTPVEAAITVQPVN